MQVPAPALDDDDKLTMMMMMMIEEQPLTETMEEDVTVVDSKLLWLAPGANAIVCPGHAPSCDLLRAVLLRPTDLVAIVEPQPCRPAN